MSIKTKNQKANMKLIILGTASAQLHKAGMSAYRQSRYTFERLVSRNRK